MALTVKQLEAAKPKNRLYRISDERGLYLEIPPTGNKRWRFRYRFQGKAKMISLGRYPEIPLADARKARERCREMVEKGVDPAVKRKEAEEAVKVEGETFGIVFKEWFARNKSTWTEKHSTTITSRIENNVLPWLGDKPISQIEPPEILQVLRRIESRGAIETAHRVKGIISQVFRFAVASGLAQRDQAADLKDALAPVKVAHHPSITDPNKIGPLLRAIWGYEGHHVTRCALKLVVLTFVRSSELRFAEWSEVDLESAEWRIPAERMKARRPHIVPLSRQSIEVFKDILPLTGSGEYIFPSIRTNSRPMSENTVNAALRRLGYSKQEMTGHGFRSMASTNLHEQGWPSDIIERQLAHVEGNSVKAAYNYAEHLPERTRMMQAWADYLDGLRTGAKVVPIRTAG